MNHENGADIASPGVSATTAAGTEPRTNAVTATGSNPAVAGAALLPEQVLDVDAPPAQEVVVDHDYPKQRAEQRAEAAEERVDEVRADRGSMV